MRRTGVVLTGLALVGLLAACGGQTAAPDNTQPAGSTTTETKLPAFDNVELLSGATKQAVQGQNTARVSVSVVVDGRTESEGECVLLFGAHDSSYDCTYRLGRSGARVLSLPDGLYMQAEALQVPGGKPWIKITGIDDESDSESLGQVGQGLGEVTDFEKLLPPGSKIDKVSSEQVDGVTTTRYDVTVDVGTVLEQATDETQKRIARIARIAQRLELTTLNYSIWIGTDNLPRKVEMPVPASQGGLATMQTTISDWGKPVEITAPSPDQVQEVDASQLGG